MKRGRRDKTQNQTKQDLRRNTFNARNRRQSKTAQQKLQQGENVSIKQEEHTGLFPRGSFFSAFSVLQRSCLIVWLWGRSILSLQSLSQQLVVPIWASSACRKDINSEMLSLSFSWVSYCQDPRLSQVHHGPDLGRVTAALATPDTHGSDFLGHNFQNSTGAGKDMTRIRHLHLKNTRSLAGNA